MQMARSSLRFLFSTNNELLSAGIRCGQNAPHQIDRRGGEGRVRCGDGFEPPVQIGRLVGGSEDCYAVPSVAADSTTVWTTWGAGSWTLDCSTALGAAFRVLDFGATFFVALTWAGRCFLDGATTAFFRFAAALPFGLAASAFFVLSSCQRFF